MIMTIKNSLGEIVKILANVEDCLPLFSGNLLLKKGSIISINGKDFVEPFKTEMIYAVDVLSVQF